MSILSSIFSKIFPSSHAGTPSPTAAPTPIPAPTSTPAVATAPASPPVAAAAQQAPMAEVDVTALLDGLNAKSGQKLNWKTSIVDLMKLLGLDSSLDARKQLAQELHYGGDTNDSAAMNTWLHRQVMTKVAANGGKMPDELK
ncbi:hypothetical protein RD110_16845 [Rhodoferax koreense]|uniref:DUF3597 domain-containing protein n=1 Tax=Rhodoferax koreensis TaxID=1842727 RepID=A0A1P8JY32_9BURK|nr:DUF3597 domain-containing protein [Rhodoferax koreense]APW38662.1 hypothetical protein RD110_16845 [Rhodoferax koreense]